MTNKRKSKRTAELTHEFIPVGWNCIHSMTAKEIAALSLKKWSPTTLKQLASKLEMAMKSEDFQERQSVAVEVFTDNGSTVNYLFVPELHSPFSLAEDLRVSWGAKLRVSKNVEFSISHVEEMEWDERMLIDICSSLFVLSRWTVTEFKKVKASALVPDVANWTFNSSVPHDEQHQIRDRAHQMADAQNNARRIASLPYSHMNSAKMVEEALRVGHEIPDTEVMFYDREVLENMGAGAFCAVIQGTKYSGGGIVSIKRKTGKTKPVVLVGKGITFDTGGLTLKLGTDMTGMHRDKTGAAVTLSVFKELCNARPDLDLSVYLAIGENLVSEKSYKVGDILTAMNKKTIEVDDTDAEGRLVLYDTLVLADNENTSKHTTFISVATLTGSCIAVAGPQRAVVGTNKEKLWSAMYEVGRKSTERIVPVPIDEEFYENLSTSVVADVAQNTGFEAEHCYAAALLASVVSPLKTFIHLDIGGTEFAANGLGLCDTAVTGFGCRFLYRLIDEELAPVKKVFPKTTSESSEKV